MSRKINVIVTGGFGQNILYALMKKESFPLIQDNLKLFALDTSDKNFAKFRKEELAESITLKTVDGADGSGSFRGENNEAITLMVKNFVESGELEEGTVIVVSSASGGSGAMAAADVMQFLVAKGRSVIGMFLETDEDDTKVNNTLKTVKTLRAKAKLAKGHFNVFWDRNRGGDKKVRKADADKVFLEALEDLITIGHPDMDKLDTMDIKNWLGYPRIPEGGEGEVRFLSIVRRNKDADFEHSDDVPVAVLSLLRSQSVDQDLARGVGYSTHGILPEKLDFSDDREEIQFQLRGGRLAKLANELEATIKEYDKIRTQQEKTAIGNDIKVGEDEAQDDNGNFL